MIKRLKRIIGIIKTAGLKKTSEMVIIKFERFAVSILSPAFILIAKRISFSKNNNSRHVLILLEQRYSVSAQNRAYDLSEYLEMAGYKVTIASPISSVFQILQIRKYSIVVFQRNIISKIINAFLEFLSSNKIPMVYDCDDLTYDPELAFNLKEDVSSSAERLLKVANEHYAVYSRCPFFLTTTDYLAAHSKKKDASKQVFILRNGLNKRYVNICNNLRKPMPVPTDRIIIGYMSGTASHNEDFRIVEKILYNLLEAYPNVYLKIVGLLKIPEYFFQGNMKDRIIKIPFVDFYSLPETIQDFCINIAPSIIGNPFTEGKSELKFVFAGYLGIPTVASATDAFKSSITNFHSGIVCSDETEWKEALYHLINNFNERKRIGENAYKYISEEYMPEIMKEKTDKIFRQITG